LVISLKTFFFRDIDFCLETMMFNIIHDNFIVVCKVQIAKLRSSMLKWAIIDTFAGVFLSLSVIILL